LNVWGIKTFKGGGKMTKTNALTALYL